VFLFAAAQLGWVCGLLAPVALAIVFWYSLAKRVTPYTQLFLGLAMAVAPVGGWLAAGGGSRFTATSVHTVASSIDGGGGGGGGPGGGGGERFFSLPVCGGVIGPLGGGGTNGPGITACALHGPGPPPASEPAVRA
jgi:hypothetical protein